MGVEAGERSYVGGNVSKSCCSRTDAVKSRPGDISARDRRLGSFGTGSEASL